MLIPNSWWRLSAAIFYVGKWEIHIFNLTQFKVFLPVNDPIPWTRAGIQFNNSKKSLHHIFFNVRKHIPFFHMSKQELSDAITLQRYALLFDFNNNYDIFFENKTKKNAGKVKNDLTLWVYKIWVLVQFRKIVFCLKMFWIESNLSLSVF